MKMHHFRITVQEYHARGRENLFPDLYGCPNSCCHFEGRLRRHGFYERNVLTLLAVYVVFIQRYYCPACKRTASLLPSFLAPYFQYSLSCIFFVLFQTAVRRISFVCIAEKVNNKSGRGEMSHQHIGFYRKRVMENRPIILGFRGSMELVVHVEQQQWLETFCHTIYRWGIQDFNLRYFGFMSKSFLNMY